MFKFFSKISKKKDVLDKNLLTPQRFNDGIMIITQDNKLHSLKIEAANMNAFNMLGYSNGELLDHDLREFVTDEIKSEIDANIEFSESGKPLYDVLIKVRHFKMKTKNGGILPLRLRIVRSLSTQDAPRFQLVINDSMLYQMLEEAREIYRTGMLHEEIYDPLTNVLSRISILRDLGTLSTIAVSKPFMGTAVSVEINNYESIQKSFGKDVASLLAKQVLQRVQLGRREDDIVGVYDERSFVLILLETPFENISVPVRRLKHTVESHVYTFDFGGVKNSTNVSINISYRKILPNINPEKFLEDIRNGNGVAFE
jgi:diguanylate cyclase (GGDEF)-like protein